MSERAQEVLAWFATAVSCLYFAWAYQTLGRHLGAFQAMFEGLGAEVPPSTQFLIDNQAWFCPLLFGAAILGVLGKEFLIRDKRLSLTLTLTTAILVVFVVEWIKVVYYFPLFGILEKLS